MRRIEQNRDQSWPGLAFAADMSDIFRTRGMEAAPLYRLP